MIKPARNHDSREGFRSRGHLHPPSAPPAVVRSKPWLACRGFLSEDRPAGIGAFRVRLVAQWWPAVDDAAGSAVSPGQPWPGLTCRGARFLRDVSIDPNKTIESISARQTSAGRPGHPLPCGVTIFTQSHVTLWFRLRRADQRSIATST